MRAIAMDQIECTGDEARLADCPFQGNGQVSRFYSDIHLICVLEPEVGQTGDLRLVGIEEYDFTIKGGLQVFNGAWGPVCDDYFGQLDAAVACRQLGYLDPGKSHVWYPATWYGQRSVSTSHESFC